MPWVNRSRSLPHCIYFVVMSASSNALETSIPEFSAVKEGDVASSPSPLLKTKHRQTGICLPWINRSRSHPHCICFVAMSASSNALETINPRIFSCERGRRCLVSLSARKKQRSANRYLFAVVKLLLFASPPAFVELEWTLPATSWKHQWTHLQLHKRAMLPCRSLRHEQTKQSQAGNLFLYVRCPTSHTSYVK